MNVRTVCTGSFLLPLPPAEAVLLFTPEGERRWAGPSWDPAYPVSEAAGNDSAPGTVFTTEAHSGSATWIVLEHGDREMRYARVIPGLVAGTIAVTCAEAGGPEQTRVEVTYDATSLSPDGVAWVEDLESTYDEFLEHWRGEIVALLPE